MKLKSKAMQFMTTYNLLSPIVNKRICSYQKVIELRKRYRWGSIRISKFLNISLGTVNSWLYRGSKPNGWIQTPTFSDKNVLSYIIGVLEGDGSKAKGNERVTLNVKDKKFAEEFANALQKIGIRPKWGIYQEKNGTVMWRVFANSKILCEWYNALDVEKLVLSSDNTIKMFLKGFFESEGMFDSKRMRIHIYNSNLKRIGITIKCLEKLGFKVSIDKAPTEYVIRILGGAKEVKRFLHSIKPCIKSGDSSQKARRQNTAS